jgi:uncharacterized membrane protein
MRSAGPTWNHVRATTALGAAALLAIALRVG